jgi:hypothetical protein
MITYIRNRPIGSIGMLLVMAAMVMIALVACSDTGKGMQPYQDAKVSGANKEPAIVGTMPDGFSNFAAKCDGPNMVYVVYHGDSVYASLDVVANDPRCVTN